LHSISVISSVSIALPTIYASSYNLLGIICLAAYSQPELPTPVLTSSPEDLNIPRFSP
jgi:hypothetical protein